MSKTTNFDPFSLSIAIKKKTLKHAWILPYRIVVCMTTTTTTTTTTNSVSSLKNIYIIQNACTVGGKERKKRNCDRKISVISDVLLFDTTFSCFLYTV